MRRRENLGPGKAKGKEPLGEGFRGDGHGHPNRAAPNRHPTRGLCQIGTCRKSTGRLGTKPTIMPTLDTMAGKKGKAGQGGKPPSKPKTRKSRNVVPAESDSPTAPVLDRDDEVTDRPVRTADHPRLATDLTAKQRRFAELLVGDPERCGWKAAWRAGYNGGDPDLPYPEDARKRKTLAQSATQALASPAVAAYVAELDARATAAFMAGPQGEVIREHVAAREAQQHDAEKLAALNLDVITAIALHDPRKVVEWDQDGIEIRDSKELEYHEAILVKEVKCEEVFTEEGPKRTTTVKFADRAPYVKMLEQRLGKWAPVRHEVSGPNGGPIRHEIEEAPDADILEECAAELLGVVPASVSEQERGLAPDEVIAILQGWAADPEPHVGEAHQLFSEGNIEESRARYLGDED